MNTAASLLFVFLSVTLAAKPLAFRIDDIQDNWISSTQRTILDVFEDRSLPATLGVIANHFGTDTALVNHIKAGVRNTNWNLEVAFHGWDHEAFESLSYNAQVNLLNMGREKLINTTGAEEVTTFLPPYHTFNADTINALQAGGWRVISSSRWVDAGPYDLTPGKSFYHLPVGATTDDPAQSVDQQWADIQFQLENDGFCVVVLSPVTYVDPADENKTSAAALAKLSQLLDRIQASDITVTTLGEIPSLFGDVPAPEPQEPAPEPQVPAPEPEEPAPEPQVPTPEPEEPAPEPQVPVPEPEEPAPEPSTCVDRNMRCVVDQPNAYQTCSRNAWGATQFCGGELVCRPTGDVIYCVPA